MSARHRSFTFTSILLGASLFCTPWSAQAFDLGSLGEALKQVDQVVNQNQRSQRQPPANSGNSVLDKYGGMLGLDQKKINLGNQIIKTVQAMQPIDEEAELILGETVSLEALSRYGGLYDDPKLTEYVNKVGLTIAEVSERPELDYRFAILNSREKNAFAAPGGYVFVTIGLLENLRDEAELATVLAHEIAHIDRKHMLGTLERSSFLKNVAELSMTAMDNDPKLLSGVVDMVTDVLFTHGLDKGLEHEADQYGVKYAYWAGYDPTAMGRHLKRLHDIQGRAHSVFYTTHPPLTDRIRQVNRQVAKLHDTNRLATLQERFRRNTRSPRSGSASRSRNTSSHAPTTSIPKRRYW